MGYPVITSNYTISSRWSAVENSRYFYFCKNNNFSKHLFVICIKYTLVFGNIIFRIYEGI